MLNLSEHQALYQISEDFDSLPVAAMVVAKYILHQRNQQSRETTPLDLLKLVDLAHGWFLGIYGNPLIQEAVYAWPYGPVVPVIYETFRSYRGDPIDLVPANNCNDLDSKQRAVIDETLRVYGDLSSWQLSAITHQPGSPWDQVSSMNLGLWSIIPNSLIQEHYAGLYEGQYAN